MTVAISSTTTSGTRLYGSSPLTFSHTADSDLLLVCVLYSKGDGSGGHGVTFNGDALTLLGTEAANGTTAACRWYYKKNPTAGAHNVVVSWSANESVVAFALSVTGADVAGTTFTSVSSSGDLGTAITTTVTGLTTNDLVLAGFSLSQQLGTRTLSLGSGLSSEGDTTNGSGSDSGRGAVATKAGGASVVMDATASAGWVYSTVSFGVIALADAPSLDIPTQPSTTASGYVMSPSPVVQMTTDGSTVDTSFTGNITAAIIGAGGVLLGTTTVAAVAGVATFSALRPCIAGSYTLRFSASGVTDLDSDSFTVTTAGGGSGTILLGGGMITTQIRRNDGTAALRRIYFDIRDDAGAAWADSVTGVKAKLGVNGVGNDDSPADIVRVAGALHYVELAQTDTDIAEGSVITARVPAASGRFEATGAGQIIPSDSYAAGITQAGLVNAIVRAANGADGYAVAKDPDNNQITLTIPGVGTVNIPAVFSTASLPIDAVGGE